MKIRYRVALAIVGATSLFCGALSFWMYTDVVKRERVQFVQNYSTRLEIIENTLVELEKAAEIIATNALYAWREETREHGLRPDSELSELAKQWRVSHLFATDQAGRFIRSTNGPIDAYEHGLFDYCDGYRGLLDGTVDGEHTPILPSMDEATAGPFKYVMMPNHDRTGVLEASISLDFIGEVLLKAHRIDGNLREIALYAENGVHLGRIGGPQKSETWVDPAYLRALSKGISWQDDTMIIGKHFSTSLQNCCECSMKNLTGETDIYSYYVIAKISTDALKEAIAQSGQRLFSFLCVLVAVGMLVAWQISRYLVKRLEEIACGVGVIVGSDDLEVRFPVTGSDEISTVSRGLNAMMQRLREAINRQVAEEKERSTAATARQVAHDIRSPLAAIRMALADLGKAPEETRRLLRSAAFRIEDISNQLFEVNAVGDPQKRRPTDETRPLLLSSVVEMIVSEKRTEYRQHLHVDIEFAVDGTSYGVFVALAASDFKRVISNLINNAVEALHESGAVRVSVRREDDKAVVEIADNGCGIPSHVLEKLGREEVTYGKVEGHGIGVHSAQLVLKRFHGRIEYQSMIEKGTTARITLPLAAAPPWFLERLQLRRRGRVVIADDDVSIHGVWDERFRRSLPEIQVDHVSSPGALVKLVGSATDCDETCYLVDFEFLGETTTGLDLIEQLKIARQSLLVTSRFEEETVLAGCRRLGVKMIPKSAAQHVPLRVDAHHDGSVPDAALLDDDQLIRTSWSMAAKRAGVNLSTYATESDLLLAAEKFPATLPIYVDFDLNTSRNGLQVVERLSKKGFTQVFLATGFEGQKFDTHGWTAGIVGKDAPF